MRMLLRMLPLVMVILVLVLPAAQAQVDYAAELETIRSMVNQAVDLYEAGRQDEAYRVARDAYLEHYELLEMPLRSLDPQHVFEMEDMFKDFRLAIRGGESIEVVRAIARDILRGLEYDEVLLLGRPSEAYGLVIVMSFALILREGLEAALIVGAIVGYLQVSNQSQLRKHVYLGTALAIGASIATYGLVAFIISITAAQRELVETIISLLAVAILFHLTFWLLHRIEHRRWMEFIRARAWYAISSGSMLALGGLAFLVVYREGFETVLFYQALLFIAAGFETYVLLGFGLGVLALLVSVAAINLFAARVPLKAFFGFTVGISAFLSVAFLGNAVKELQALDYLPLTPVAWVPALHPILSDLTGIRPTLESLLAQVLMVLIYVLGGLYIFVIQPLAERAAGRAVESMKHQKAEASEGDGILKGPGDEETEEG